MAIYDPGIPGGPSRVVDGLLYAVSTTKPQTITQARSNLKKSITAAKGQLKNNSHDKAPLLGTVTPGFVLLNQTITHLDALFDLLPNQAAWNAYAAAIAGEWGLCANCAPDTAGKKLFRQMNFTRAVQGLSTITTPPPGGPYCVASFVYMESNGYGTERVCSLYVAPPQDGVIFLQASCGLGMRNPWVTFTMADTYTPATQGQPIYTFVQAVMTALGIWGASTFQGPPVQCCIALQGGEPGVPATGPAYWIP